MTSRGLIVSDREKEERVETLVGLLMSQGRDGVGLLEVEGLEEVVPSFDVDIVG